MFYIAYFLPHSNGGVPAAEIVDWVGFLALIANCASVLLLMSYKDGDANVRSV